MPTHRTNGNLIHLVVETLKRVPPWAVPLVAAAVYFLVGSVLPQLFLQLADGINNPVITSVAVAPWVNVIRGAAPIAAGITLLLWLTTLPSRGADRRRVDKQTGLVSIRALPWPAFESLLAETFRRQGHRVEETAAAAGGGPDGGVDLVLRRRGERILVQAKQWRTQKVGVKIVRELAGVVAAEQADGGMVATSGTFTRDAQSFAARAGLRLVDGQELAAMVRGTQRHPSPPPRVAPAVQHRASAAPRHQAPSPASPHCPDCGASMVLRTAQRGPTPGNRFWGCTQYARQRCCGTRPLAT